MQSSVSSPPETLTTLPALNPADSDPAIAIALVKDKARADALLSALINIPINQSPSVSRGRTILI